VINILIWFLCACAIFVIAALGPIICPTGHIFDSTEIKSHTVKHTPDQVYTFIHGEVFDLAQTHQLVAPVVSQKSLLHYGGNDGSDIFPIQVSALCNGRTGSVSP
jgi:chitin synthase